MVEADELTKVFHLPPVRRQRNMLYVGLRRALRLAKKRQLIAVDHVNLRIERGEFFGLLGPNGAGKTTLIKLLSGLLTADDGRAIVNGYDVFEERDKVKASVTIVPTGGWIGLDWSMTVFQNLELFGRLYGLPKNVIHERIHEALKLLDLTDKKDELPEHISGGMRQKVNVAKGLIIRTPLLFLDEPTMGLDPNISRAVRNLVKDFLNKTVGQTVLMTTHYVEEAEMLCDRVAIMHEGKIIACDTPKKLKRMIQKTSVIVVGVLNASPDLPEKIRNLQHVDRVNIKLEDVVVGSGILRVHSPNKEELMPELIKTMDENNVRIRYVNTESLSLEDVFLYMTGKGL